MPRNDARDTKEVILNVALKLFSERGYDGVGVRDIAKEIGIRESALYKHYSGKQDIFDSILKEMEGRYNEAAVSSQITESMAAILAEQKDERKELFMICLAMFQFYLKDEYGSQLRRMLTMEQYRNTQAGKTFRELIIDNGLDYISNIFRELIKKGFYANVDPAVMAIQFYSPIYLLLSKYDGLPDKYDEALYFLEKHMTQFNTMYTRSDS